MKHLKVALLLAAALVVLVTITGGIWLFQLDRSIKKRFAEKRFASPVEFYSAPEAVRPGTSYPAGYFESLFKRKNFRQRNFGQPIQAGDFSIWTPDQCRTVVPVDPLSFDLARCVAFKNSTRTEVRTDDPSAVQIIALSGDYRVTEVFAGAQPAKTNVVRVEPEIFAQYYGVNPVLRNVVTLGETPTSCLNALLAIEDSKFLEHPGVSFTGLFRAFITNLRSGRKAQGGSTITQQLVKNYFLSDEKTLKRKMTEIAMAFLVERHASKDEILETYINLIYMGQNGPFQVRGFAAASEHYFGKPLRDLGTGECALLAAVLNSPGLYNPFKAPERAAKRRALVLDRMQELGMISEEQEKQTAASALPNRPQRLLTEPAPYFVQAVRRDLDTRGIDSEDGLRVYTTLNLRAQEAAHQAVRSGLDRLETRYKQIKKLKESGKNLEAVLVSSDPQTGAVEALVGGRGFLATQFNRAVDSRRQVGSVMKPFVFLSAFENLTPSGEPYTPLTTLNDTSTTHKFEGQKWTPRNYDGAYRGEVPLYYALKESLNAATVNLGMSLGLSNVIDVASRTGIASQIKPLPSLTLGAFELSPFEVLQSYGTIANLGDKAPLTLVWRVEDLQGKIIFAHDPTPELVVSKEAASLLVGVMKETMVSGTARGARLSGFTHPSAGKTGTTNDKKDAWFAGFTPHHNAVVWVGYDDNTSHELTGGSGAVPIWASYMKDYGSHLPADDFAWPESMEKAVLPPEYLISIGVPEPKNQALEPVELIFRKGQAPSVPGTSAPISDPSSFPSGFRGF